MCMSVNWASMGSRNGSSSVRHQVITWTKADSLKIGPLWTIFIEISIEIQTFSLKKRHLKMPCAIFPLSCPGRDGLIHHMPPISSCFFIYHSWICVIYLPIYPRVTLLGTSTIIWLSQFRFRQSNPKGYGQIYKQQTKTKHNKCKPCTWFIVCTVHRYPQQVECTNMCDPKLVGASLHSIILH